MYAGTELIERSPWGDNIAKTLYVADYQTLTFQWTDNTDHLAVSLLWHQYPTNHPSYGRYAYPQFYTIPVAQRSGQINIPIVGPVVTIVVAGATGGGDRVKISIVPTDNTSLAVTPVNGTDPRILSFPSATTPIGTQTIQPDKTHCGNVLVYYRIAPGVGGTIRINLRAIQPSGFALPGVIWSIAGPAEGLVELAFDGLYVVAELVAGVAIGNVELAVWPKPVT